MLDAGAVVVVVVVVVDSPPDEDDGAVVVVVDPGAVPPRSCWACATFCWASLILV